MNHHGQLRIRTRGVLPEADLYELQKLHEHGKSTFEQTQADAQRVTCLLSEANYWTRKFAGALEAYSDLVAKHSELLLKYDIAVSRNLGDGRTILDNTMLREELASYKPPILPVTAKGPRSYEKCT